MTAFKKIIPPLIFALLFIAPSVEGSRTCRLTITNSQGKPVVAEVAIADTPALRHQGLMFRRILDKNEGMLFVFPKAQALNFWMKNTYIPLTIAYIDSRGIIREMYDMKPLDISVRYASKRPARYALEMSRGWFGRNNITIGSKIQLNGCIGK